MYKKSFIVGYPLNKPRSVPIWRAHFKERAQKIKMSPKEILPKYFKQEFKEMTDNKDFLASAVTMPYKKLVYKKIIPYNKITELSKSVNLVIKYKEKLIGFNTDIEAALEVIRSRKKNIILIVGLGGTGAAFFNVLRKKYRKSQFYVVTSQNKKSQKNVKFMKKIDSLILSKIDLIINCTPLGSNLKNSYLNKSPLNLSDIKKVNKRVFIFDIVYKPKKNLLSKLCANKNIKYENGLKMNLLQAKFALKYLDKFSKKNEKNNISY